MNIVRVFPVKTDTPPNGTVYQLKINPGFEELASRVTFPALQTESCVAIGLTGLGKILIHALVSLVSGGEELIIRTLKQSPPFELTGIKARMVSALRERSVPI
jgi:hypothetical protein